MIVGISGKIGSGKDTVGKIIQYIIERRELVRKANRNKNLTKKEFEEITETCEEDFLDYEYDSKYCSYEIKKYAGKLKDIVCLLTDCTREQLEDEEFKNLPLGEEWRRWYWYYYKFDIKKNKGRVSEYFSSQEEAERYYDINKYIDSPFDFVSVSTLKSELLTRRKLLQLIGTECGRNLIHPNTWVNALMSEYKAISVLRDSKGKKIYDKKGNHQFNYPNWIVTDVRFPNEAKAIEDRDGFIIRVHRDDYNYSYNNKKDIKTVVDQVILDSKNHPSETALDNYKAKYTIDNNGTIEDLIIKVKEILIKEKLI